MRDGVLLLALLLVVAWSLWILSGGAKRFESVPSASSGLLLRPGDGPDWGELLRRIREIPPRAADPRWAPPRLKSDWQYIVVHHSATLAGSAASFDRYHRTKPNPMENGLAYHFVIGNGHGSGDGMVEIGNRWRRQIQGGHVRGDELNEISIGICLVGDFERHAPTDRQIAALKGLLLYLMDLTAISPRYVKGHTHMPGQSSVCPGRYLPLQELMGSLPPSRAVSAEAEGETDRAD